ncbi:MAG: TetR/AcrR family transcriptional regulator [Lachnospiraceae bacterium]|nr:TetR/AcrR family transcriptional regulator [Lachnospiraceae bacterium]
MSDQTIETELKKREVLRMSNAESKRLTKECIQTALIYLMGQQPFEKITITSIIKRSGVSRAGFYRNYSSKEEVLQDIGSRLYQQLLEASTDEKYKDNPYQLYLDCFRKIEEQADQVRLFIQANLPLDFIFDTVSLLRQTPKDQSTTEHYRQIAIESARREIAISWFQKGMKESPEEMANICVSIFHAES